MAVFASSAFDQHESVHFCHDAQSGLRAIIAIHNTRLGPATGGCRMYPYANEAQAVDDVLRLSRAMSLKSAMAGLPLGGGKAVIIGDPRKDKSAQLLRAMGHFVDSLDGRYVTAEDAGVGPRDLQVMAMETDHVAGLPTGAEHSGVGGGDGDPSPFTARGIFAALSWAVAHKLGRTNLVGVRVAVQGAGAVGLQLIALLLAAEAEVSVWDIDPVRIKRATNMGSQVGGEQSFITAEVDVLAPCAMGGIFTPDNLDSIRAPIIVGAANNQLANAEVDAGLLERGVLYAPDFVTNAGGIIKVYCDRAGLSLQDCYTRIDQIVDNLSQVMALASRAGGYQRAAEQIALSRLGQTGPKAGRAVSA